MQVLGTVERDVADGRIEVVISRRHDRAAIIVSSRNAMPKGGQHRYRQFVRPAAVVAAVRAWADALPADYCLSAPCNDSRTHWWAVLRDRLRDVPCVGTAEEAMAVD